VILYGSFVGDGSSGALNRRIRLEDTIRGGSEANPLWKQQAKKDGTLISVTPKKKKKKKRRKKRRDTHHSPNMFFKRWS
jgi:hypothetical protein